MVSEMVQAPPFVLQNLVTGNLFFVQKLRCLRDVLQLALIEKEQLVAQLVRLQCSEAGGWRLGERPGRWVLMDRLEVVRLKVLLRESLRRVELFSMQLRLCKELIRCFLAMLLQKLLDSLLFSCNRSEFPNKQKPPCSTMPWNIPPALVVLWGVCWMFNPWNHIDDIQLPPLWAGDPTCFADSGKVFPHSDVHVVQLTSSKQILTTS